MSAAGLANKKPNRLAQEKSPYLLQHAYNPVDWYPWGAEAFEKAKKENKMIFLSGYSTCHWCHVMERESFENDQIGELLNENFVSVKVDREERPDVDKMYITFIQTIQKCYEQLLKNYDMKFGGFNKEPKFPQPVNLDFLLRYYKKHKEGENGKKALEMVEKTLLCMSRGGIHDHVGQGFHRYSTDQRWHVPHFEKMLYDQAQLACVYAEAYQITKNTLYAQVVRDILEYVERDLSHPEGGFFSAEDADSLCIDADINVENGTEIKKEGAFYVWTDEAVRRILNEPLKKAEGKTLADVFCRHYTVRDGGNLHPYADPHGELTNQNVLISFNSAEETGKEFGMDAKDTEAILRKCREMLFSERLSRPRPHLDTKIVTAWNGLMISGFAKAAQALNDKKFAERGQKAVNFVKKYLSLCESKESNIVGSELLRSCYTENSKNDGSIVIQDKPIRGFVDDYAFLISGLLDLYECTFEVEWLDLAERLQRKMDELFWDAETDAGYFLSPKGDESILVRMKDDQDGAEPSANSVACTNLVRLADVLDERKYRNRAEKLVKAFGERMDKLPIVLPKMVSGVSWLDSSPFQVVICGPKGAEETLALVKAVNSVFLPEKVLIQLDAETGKH